MTITKTSLAVIKVGENNYRIMAITDVSKNAENEVTMKIQASVGISIILNLVLKSMRLPVVGFPIGEPKDSPLNGQGALE